MAHELVVNGTFTGSVSGWTKRSSFKKFIHDSNKARAMSDAPDWLRFQMYQQFTITDTVLSANIDVWRQWNVAGAGSGGHTEFWVYFRMPDGTTKTLYHHKYNSGSGSGYCLLNEDVLEYMTDPGVYTLEIACAVNPDDMDQNSRGWFDNVSFEVTLSKPLEFLDYNVFTEYFMFDKTAPMEFLDDNVLTEHFSIQRLKGLSTADERLVISLGDQKVYDLRPGTLEGCCDSDVIDFGVPGEEKRILEGILYSDSISPHSVTVYLSLDGGVTWTEVETVTLQKGAPKHVFPDYTSESFIIRIKGNSLQMVNYIFWAKLLGSEAGDA